MRFAKQRQNRPGSQSAPCPGSDRSGRFGPSVKRLLEIDVCRPLRSVLAKDSQITPALPVVTPLTHQCMSAVLVLPGAETAPDESTVCPTGTQPMPNLHQCMQEP
jgi:hypothetical protein